MTALQPFAGAITSDTYLPADPAQVLWGRLPCATDSPVLTIGDGTEVTIDTISHEGVLEDQGRDPRGFFEGLEVLDDAVALAASDYDRGDGGPHVITGPIAVEGARPGDLLRMRVVETLQRVPHGVISNRHGRGALPEEYPASGETVSIIAHSDGTHGSLPTATPIERTRQGTLKLTSIAGLTGQPALSAPLLGVPQAGALLPAPVGLCLVGPRHSELALIDLAESLAL